jgi:hypothetical protein
MYHLDLLNVGTILGKYALRNMLSFQLSMSIISLMRPHCHFFLPLLLLLHFIFSFFVIRPLFCQ